MLGVALGEVFDVVLGEVLDCGDQEGAQRGAHLTCLGEVPFGRSEDGRRQLSRLLSKPDYCDMAKTGS